MQSGVIPETPGVISEPPGVIPEHMEEWSWSLPGVSSEHKVQIHPKVQE